MRDDGKTIHLLISFSFSFSHQTATFTISSSPGLCFCPGEALEDITISLLFHHHHHLLNPCVCICLLQWPATPSFLSPRGLCPRPGGSPWTDVTQAQGSRRHVSLQMRTFRPSSLVFARGLRVLLVPAASAFCYSRRSRCQGVRVYVFLYAQCVHIRDPARPHTQCRLEVDRRHPQELTHGGSHRFGAAQALAQSAAGQVRTRE